jgi:hypothetical protein
MEQEPSKDVPTTTAEEVVAEYQGPMPMAQDEGEDLIKLEEE